MGEFFSELKRRHIYRVAAAYAVVAWVLLQLVNTVAPLLHLPDWAGTFFLVALVIGFPIALIFAWALELRTPSSAAEMAATGKADWILTGALGLVMVLIIFEQVGARSGLQSAQPPSIAAPASQVQTGGIAIALLPFVNLSGDAGQEFFSDGMTEEIISALAKVAGLKVIGRTSAFQFKGQNQDLRSIGQALSAGYLIEGSVRKAGDQVRITAQLIKADDGTHLWTENYDRQLVNIFATQEDIATAIAGALRVPLGLAQGETLVSNRTSNLQLYEQYLRGKALVRAQRPGEAIKVLEAVVASDPNFAPAWAFLARAYNGMSPLDPVVRDGSVEYARRIVQSNRTKLDVTAKQAIRLDPKLAGAYSALTGTLPPRGNYAAREDLFRQALALDANDPESLDFYARVLGSAGRVKDAMRLREQLRTVEPFDPVFNAVTAVTMRANGQGVEAIRMFEALHFTDPIGILFTNGFLAQAYAAEGRYAEAADTLLTIPASNLFSRRAIEEAARLVRQAPTQVAAPEALPVWNDPLNWVYAYAGAPERTLEMHERNDEIGFIGVGVAVWFPEYASVRKTERFKALMRKSGPAAHRARVCGRKKIIGSRTLARWVAGSGAGHDEA